MPFQKGYIPHNKGKKGISKEYSKKLSKAGKGKHFYWKGKKMSQEHKNKIGKTHKGHLMYKSKERSRKLRDANSGDKCNFWQGGIWKNKYPVEWTETLKRAIRERDKYVCRLCGNQQGDFAHAVHHIDYDKKNCNPNNLITLCQSCHSKTGIKRDYWKEFFRIIITQ